MVVDHKTLIADEAHRRAADGVPFALLHVVDVPSGLPAIRKALRTEGLHERWKLFDPGRLKEYGMALFHKNRRSFVPGMRFITLADESAMNLRRVTTTMDFIFAK